MRKKVSGNKEDEIDRAQETGGMKKTRAPAEEEKDGTSRRTSERKMKRAMNAKEEGSDDSRDTGHGDKEDEERGPRNGRKGYENEVEEVEEEVQEEVKKANGSVHTGEKNSMLKTGVGKSTVAPVDGECRRKPARTKRIAACASRE